MRSRLITLALLLVAAFFLFRWAEREDVLSRPPPTGSSPLM